MIDILSLDRAGILALLPADVDRLLTAEEFFHIAFQLDAYWSFDYNAADEGRTGEHARLKSELHSDGFFVSRILLKSENMLRIMAEQMAMKMVQAGFRLPTHVAGIPDGATDLGKVVCEILGAELIRLQKIDGKIVLVDEVPSGAIIAFPEDFCTRGTGFIETVLAVRASPLCAPDVIIYPANTVLLNRGGLKEVCVLGLGNFPVVAVVEKRINDWAPEACPLCKMGSKPVKPKVDDATWERFIHSQE